MDTKKRLEILEEKMDLIMNRLGIQYTAEPELTVISKDDSSTRLELQKTKNEIKVLKIKFRRIPPQNPMRGETLKQLEQLIQKQSKLEAELNESN